MKDYLNIGIIGIFCAVVSIVNYRIGGAPLLKEGVIGGLKFFSKIIPVIVILSVLCGQFEAYYSRKPEVVRKAINGKNGIVNAAVIGALVPGSAAMGKVLKQEWNSGGNKLAIIIFVMALTLVSWNILFYRLPFFGAEITAWIYGIGAAITLVAVVAAVLIQHFKT